MVKNYSYVGDIGTRVRTYLRSNITEASGITYYWKKPVSGQANLTEVVSHPCSVENYISGVVYYDTVDGDFDCRGEYKHQVLVEMNNGDRFRSHTVSFQVLDEFEA